MESPAMKTCKEIAEVLQDLLASDVDDSRFADIVVLLAGRCFRSSDFGHPVLYRIDHIGTICTSRISASCTILRSQYYHDYRTIMANFDARADGQAFADRLSDSVEISSEAFEAALSRINDLVSTGHKYLETVE